MIYTFRPTLKSTFSLIQDDVCLELRKKETAMGGCIGTPRDGTSHSGESSDVSGASMFLLRILSSHLY